MALSVVLEISQLVLLGIAAIFAAAAEGGCWGAAAGPPPGAADRIIEDTDGRCITLLLLRLEDMF